MKLKDKLDIFSHVAMKEAMEKYTKVLEDIENEYNRAVEEAERLARKKAEITLQTEKYKAEQLKHRETLNASTECKRVLFEHRNKLTGELFAEIKSKLMSFAKTEDYKTYLFEQIKIRTADYNNYNYEIILRSEDMKYAEEIKKITGAGVKETEEDFIGGFKMVLVDKHAVFDATFVSGFKNEQMNFNKFKAI